MSDGKYQGHTEVCALHFLELVVMVEMVSQPRCIVDSTVYRLRCCRVLDRSCAWSHWQGWRTNSEGAGLVRRCKSSFPRGANAHRGKEQADTIKAGLAFHPGHARDSGHGTYHQPTVRSSHNLGNESQSDCVSTSWIRYSYYGAVTLRPNYVVFADGRPPMADLGQLHRK